MARLATMLVISLGIMLVLLSAGINTGSFKLLENLGAVEVIDNKPVLTPQNIAGGILQSQIAAFILAITVTGLVIGFLAKTSPIPFLLGSFTAGVLIVLIADGIAVVTYAASTYGNNDWTTILIAGFMLTWVIMFLFSIIDFWRGTE